MTIDLVVRGGSVMDGSGGPARTADVGIRDGRIVAIGEITDAGAEEIAADGRIVAPGFIDVHVHADALLFADPDYPAGIRQGVTTVILGNDGIGLAPTSTDALPLLRRLWAGVFGAHAVGPEAFPTIGAYLDALDGSVAPNVGYLLPHGPLRVATMGLDDRAASPAEVAAMVRGAEAAFDDGALGFSIGLDYVPCRSAAMDEFVALARVAAAAGGPFVTHMRDYLEGAPAAIDEAFAVGAASGAAVHISHFNVPAVVGVSPVDRARTAGQDVTFDVYPYLAGAPSLAFFLPGWIQAGGMDVTLARLQDAATRRRLRDDIDAVDRRWGWDRIVISDVGDAGSAAGVGNAVGRSIRQLADASGSDVTDVVAELLIASGGAASTVTHHRHRTEQDQATLVAHDGHIGASDGVYVGARPHPRGSGTFARYLALGVAGAFGIELPMLIRHLTAAAADRFGLVDRGRIALSAAADLVVFDPARVRDRASYVSPVEPPDGIDHVLVNGVPVVRDGASTGRRPGRALLRTAEPATSAEAVPEPALPRARVVDDG